MPSRPSRLVDKGDIRLAGFMGGKSGGVQPRNGVRHRHAAVRLIYRAYKPIDRRCGVRLGPCRCCPKGFVRPRNFSLGSPVPGRKRTWSEETIKTSQQGRLRDITKNRFPNTGHFLGAKDATRYPELGLPGHFPPHTANYPCLDTGRSMHFMQ